jgi:hypothetical protein
MRTVVKWILTPLAAYLGLGWAANNPTKVKHAQNQVEQKIESGYEFTLFQFKSFSSEPHQESSRKKKKKDKKQ